VNPKPQSPPRVAVFDLGKVLVDFDYRIAARNIAARSARTPQELMDFVSQAPWLFRFETGLMTNEQFYDEVRRFSGFDGSIGEFARVFGDIFSPIEPMIELQAALRRRGLPAYIFSNTNDFAVRHIRRQYPFFGNFDGYILSYEHGAMKPEAKLYEVVERTSGARGGDILYIDDRPENIDAGTARGWQTILHEAPDKTRAQVERCGISLAPNPSPEMTTGGRSAG
jgi:FMN phosphatase YigB (HAD superfamily)